VETIDALTACVVRGAVEAYGVLRARGVRVPISVNVSARNLHNVGLPDWIEQCLSAVSMPAEHLHIEITESAAFGEAAKALDVLSRLRLKGISLSIDDFGTSYASFKVLRQMPFSEIKIDRSFVSDMDVSRDSRAIVKSIIGLAANMEMNCVAEGVESEKIAGLLEQFGLVTMQGYLIARPMAVEAIPDWLAGWIRPDFPRSDHNAEADSPLDPMPPNATATGSHVAETNWLAKAKAEEVPPAPGLG
jgi:EAL domain-containing protein (putative c-di-GMP-specific phosphodiesterase class I)